MRRESWQGIMIIFYTYDKHTQIQLLYAPIFVRTHFLFNKQIVTFWCGLPSKLVFLSQ